MYILDTNVFGMMGAYFPKRFPKLWEAIDGLAARTVLMSVREVRKELENKCPYEHIAAWVQAHPDVFPAPNAEECVVVRNLFQREQYRGFVKRDNLLKGTPVADPFVIAAGKVHGRCVVTQEVYRAGGARIPTACRELDIECVNLEQFMEREKLSF